MAQLEEVVKPAADSAAPKSNFDQLAVAMDAMLKGEVSADQPAADVVPPADSDAPPATPAGEQPPAKDPEGAPPVPQAGADDAPAQIPTPVEGAAEEELSGGFAQDDPLLGTKLLATGLVDAYFTDIDFDGGASGLVQSIFEQNGGDVVASFRAVNELILEQMVASTAFVNDDIKQMNEYVRNGGKMEDFIQASLESQNVASVDLTGQDAQRQLVTRSLRDLSNFTEAQITRYLSMMSDEVLAQEAAEAKTKLQEDYEQRLQQMQQETAQQRKTQQEARQQQIDQAVSFVKKGNVQAIGHTLVPAEREKFLQWAFQADQEGATGWDKAFQADPTLWLKLMTTVFKGRHNEATAAVSMAKMTKEALARQFQDAQLPTRSAPVPPAPAPPKEDRPGVVPKKLADAMEALLSANR